MIVDVSSLVEAPTFAARKQRRGKKKGGSARRACAARARAAAAEYSASAPAERAVSARAATLAAERGYDLSGGRRAGADARVRTLLEVARTGVAPASFADADLLPVGNPASRARHRMTPASLSSAQARWLSVDPELDAVTAALVASAMSAPDGSLARSHGLIRLSMAGSLPRALREAVTAALTADGNSRLARSMRARRQLRDRRGRWIEMGGGIRFKLRLPSGPAWMHGTAVGVDVASGKVHVKLDDGRTVAVPANKVEKIRASLKRKSPVARLAPSRAPVVDDADIEENPRPVTSKASRADRVPDGWEHNAEADWWQRPAEAAGETTYRAQRSSNGEFMVTRIQRDTTPYGSPTYTNVGRQKLRSWDDVEDAVNVDEDDVIDGATDELVSTLRGRFGDDNAAARTIEDADSTLSSSEVEDVLKADPDVSAWRERLGEARMKSYMSPDEKADDALDLKMKRLAGRIGDGIIPLTDEEASPTPSVEQVDALEPADRADISAEQELERLERLSDADDVAVRLAARAAHEYLTDGPDAPTAQELSKRLRAVADAVDSGDVSAPDDPDLADVFRGIADRAESGGTGAPSAPAPAARETEAEKPVASLPDNMYRLEDGTYEPEGNIVNSESPDYTDDPEVLAHKFSTEELAGALAQAVTGEGAFYDDIIEADDEETQAKKGKPGPKPKKPKKPKVGTGYGDLEFQYGADPVPAEAIRDAIKAQGHDAESLVARIYEGDDKGVADWAREAHGGTAGQERDVQVSPAGRPEEDLPGGREGVEAERPVAEDSGAPRPPAPVAPRPDRGNEVNFDDPELAALLKQIDDDLGTDAEFDHEAAFEEIGFDVTGESDAEVDVDGDVENPAYVQYRADTERVGIHMRDAAQQQQVGTDGISSLVSKLAELQPLATKTSRFGNSDAFIDKRRRDIVDVLSDALDVYEAGDPSQLGALIGAFYHLDINESDWHGFLSDELDRRGISRDQLTADMGGFDLFDGTSIDRHFRYNDERSQFDNTLPDLAEQTTPHGWFVRAVASSKYSPDVEVYRGMTVPSGSSVAEYYTTPGEFVGIRPSSFSEDMAVAEGFGGVLTGSKSDHVILAIRGGDADTLPLAGISTHWGGVTYGGEAEHTLSGAFVVDTVETTTLPNGSKRHMVTLRPATQEEIDARRSGEDFGATPGEPYVMDPNPYRPQGRTSDEQPEDYTDDPADIAAMWDADGIKAQMDAGIENGSGVGWLQFDDGSVAAVPVEALRDALYIKGETSKPARVPTPALDALEEAMSDVSEAIDALDTYIHETSPWPLPESESEEIDLLTEVNDELVRTWETLDRDGLPAGDVQAVLDEAADRLATGLKRYGIRSKTMADRLRGLDVEAAVAERNALYAEAPEAPEASEAPAAAPAAADVPLGALRAPESLDDQIYDISTWKKVSGQLGSNPGGWYEDEDGNRFYVKYPKSGKHARSEILASAFYKRLGVPAAEIYAGTDADGKFVTVSPSIPGAKTDFDSRVYDQEYKKKIQDGFAVDAWLANWDVAGLVFDNVVSDDTDSPVRVDPGGALIFRAQGAPKGAAFGDKVSEVDTLRDVDMNYSSGTTFGDMTDDDVAESAKKLLDISPEEIDETIDSAGFDADTAEMLKSKLRARRQDLLDRFGVGEPAEAEPPREDVLPASETGLSRDLVKNAHGTWAENLPPGDVVALKSGAIEPPARPMFVPWNGNTDVNLGEGYFFSVDGKRYWGQFGAGGQLLFRRNAETGEPEFFLGKRAGWISGGGGTWGYPGGAHYDASGDADPSITATAEFNEETGSPIPESAQQVGVYVDDVAPDWRYQTVISEVPAGTEIDTAGHDGETSEFGWFPASELVLMAAKGQLHPAMAKNIDNLLEMAGVPETETAPAPEPVNVPEPEIAPIPEIEPVTPTAPGVYDDAANDVNSGVRQDTAGDWQVFHWNTVASADGTVLDSSMQPHPDAVGWSVSQVNDKFIKDKAVADEIWARRAEISEALREVAKGKNPRLNIIMNGDGTWSIVNYDTDQKYLDLPAKNAPEPAPAPAPAPAPEPESVTIVVEKYLSSNGTPLQIGMKVVSQNDGLKGEVVKYDKNPKYVFVKGEDGKKKVRAASTLQIVDTDSSVSAPAEPEPTAPTTAVKAPTRIADADFVSLKSASDVAVGERVWVRFNGDGKTWEIEPVTVAVVGDTFIGLSDGSSVEYWHVMKDSPGLNPPGGGGTPPGDGGAPTPEAPAGGGDGGETAEPAALGEAAPFDLASPEATPDPPLLDPTLRYKAYTSTFSESGEQTNLMDLLFTKARWEYMGRSVQVDDGHSLVVAKLEPPNDGAGAWVLDANDNVVAYRAIPSDFSYGEEGSGLIAWADAVRSGVAPEPAPAPEPEPEPAPALSLGAGYAELPPGAVPLAKFNSEFPKQFGITTAVAVRHSDGSIMLYFKGGTVEKALSQKPESYTKGNKWVEWSPPLPEPEYQAAPVSSPSPVSGPPPGAIGVMAGDGSMLYPNSTVVDKAGEAGVVKKIEPNGKYAQVKLASGKTAVRSIKTLKVTGYDVGAGYGMSQVPVMEPEKFDPSGIDWDSSLPGMASLPAAIKYVAESARNGWHGTSVPTDNGDIEDLDVRVMRIKDASGRDVLQLKFKLTSWAGNDLAKEAAKTWQAGPVKITKWARGDDGLPQETTSASFKGSTSSSGRTFTTTLPDGTVIRFHKSGSQNGMPRDKYAGESTAFHNLVQINLPADATEEQIALALRAAGVRQPRAATESDARTLIENRMMSVFAGHSNPAKNLEGQERQKALADIYAALGISPDDFVVTHGASGRVEIRGKKSVVERLKKHTGVRAFVHSLYMPSKLTLPDGTPVTYGMASSQSQYRAEWLAQVLMSPQGGILSTTTRWSEGIGAHGQSSEPDISTGGADYVFLSPRPYPDGTVSPYGTTLVLPPEAFMSRIDWWVNVDDKYGKRSITNPLHNLTPYASEAMLKHRVGWESVWYLATDSSTREKLLEILRARGVTEIGGRPIEVFIPPPNTPVADLPLPPISIDPQAPDASAPVVGA